MNYILLFPDEMRAESLHCYGNPYVETPHIDALASEGTLFYENYTAHPVCGPSRCCLVDGWYPHVDGRRTYYMLKDTDPNFIRPLNEAGFTTCHAGKNDMFDNESMGRIFGEYLPFYRRDVTKNFHAIDGRYSLLYPPIPEDQADELGDNYHTMEAQDFIRRHAHDDNPFFLMVSFMFPHPPYTAPESYYYKYDPEKVPFPRGFDWTEGKPDFYRVLRQYRETTGRDEMYFRRLNAVYLGMISYVDNCIGRIIQTLKEEKLYDNTTIILCSDHGDYAGDAGQTEKWPSDMTDMLTRVPLIIRRPGAPKGQIIKTPTQSFDIFPTILDYENIKLDYQQFGVSLKKQVEGMPGDETRTVYCEGGYDTDEPQCFEPTCFIGTPLEMPLVEGTDYYPKCLQQQECPDTVCRVVMQRDNEWKLIVRTNGQNELYHMKEDPLEKHNCYNDPDCRAIRDEKEKKLLNWLIHTSDVVPIHGR